MYLKRKIDGYLDDWLHEEGAMPLLIAGIRQCGKTESVREFAKRNSLRLIELNFMLYPEQCSDFDGDLSVDRLISDISLRFRLGEIDSKRTILFFDEIQDCPRARLSFKSFASDGRFRVIGSGSYLGISGYDTSDASPAPTGFDRVCHMNTLDFEEFLWSQGQSEEQIDRLVGCFEKKEPIPENLHQLYKELLLRYICIGGFPKVVSEYNKAHNVMAALQIMQSTIFDMKSDFGRRKGKNGQPVFKPSEVARIQSVFDLVPTFLAKENKRFVVSKIPSGSTEDKKDAVEYLRQAHIVEKVHNLETPSLPLLGQKIDSQFKLFPTDIGLVTSMYGLDTISAINKGNLGQGKGAIYESLVFDALHKAGIDTFYFAKESGLEIDFVISYKGYATLVETKAKNGNAKSSKTVMKHPDHYGQVKLIKIGDYNVSQEGDVITIPHYLTFALGKTKINF